MRDSVSRTPDLEARLLGPPQFRHAGKDLALPLSGKTMSLLAYLLLTERVPHPREALAALFWGESSDEHARHSLRTALATLRKAIGADLLLSDRDTIFVNPDLSIWVDALELKRYAATPPPRELGELQEALDLCRGELLPGLYDDWALRERELYRTLYLDLMLQLTQMVRSRSEYDRAIACAEKVLQVDPANERAHQHLIFCRLAQGDRSGALRQFDECKRLLREELSVDPSPATVALHDWVAQAETQAPEARITNLPIPLTSFIGREREMARVKELLARARLVTLAGSGGCGKTRLAIQVASDLVDAFADGVWWVDFAPLTEARLIEWSVAKALGVSETSKRSPRESLAEALRPRKTLLVLDNCDHLVGEVAELATVLLSRCPGLKILTTSREVLGVAGEEILRVPSLSFPMSQRLMPGEKPEDYESIRLLHARIASVRPGFTLTPEDTPAIAQICKQLDGIPLAIELAAARIRVLSVTQVATRLNDRFSLLAGGGPEALPRHRTLRAVMDWSYGLLTEPEQTLLNRLSVFVGGWSLEGAEAVLADSAPHFGALDPLARLADKSLVEVSDRPGGRARYHMLETVRQYGLEQLGKSGQEDITLHLHSLHYAGLAEEAEQGLRGPELRTWIEQLEAEHDNLRAALQWAVTREPPEVGLRFAGGLGIFWRRRGYLSEGRMWLERLLAHGSDHRSPLRVKAMVQASWLARDLGDYERSLALETESLDLLRHSDNTTGMLDALVQGGLLAVYRNETSRAVACFNECLALAEGLGSRWGRAMALVNLAHAALFDLRWDAQARERAEQSLELFRKLNDETEQAHALIILGAGAHYESDDRRALTQLEQAVSICDRSGDRRQLAWATTVKGLVLRWLGGTDEALQASKEGLRLALQLGEKTITVFATVFLALLAKDQGDVARGVRLLSSAIASGESFGYELSSFMRDVIQADADGMRAYLGEQAFAKAWADGRAMSAHHAAQDALQSM